MLRLFQLSCTFPHYQHMSLCCQSQAGLPARSWPCCSWDLTTFPPCTAHCGIVQSSTQCKVYQTCRRLHSDMKLMQIICVNKDMLLPCSHNMCMSADAPRVKLLLLTCDIFTAVYSHAMRPEDELRLLGNLPHSASVVMPRADCSLLPQNINSQHLQHAINMTPCAS